MNECLREQSRRQVFVVSVRRGDDLMRLGPFLTVELARKVGERWGSPGQIAVAATTIRQATKNGFIA